jgi:hypothetical protein
LGISWSNRVIADAKVTGVIGGRSAGGYILRLAVEFNVMNWNGALPFPVVLMSPARIGLHGQTGLSIGLAHPETIQPFTVSPYAKKIATLFDLFLTQQAMEALERHRNGLGVTLTVRLQAEVRLGNEIQIAREDLTGDFNLSQWIVALDQAGFGRSVLFEVPIPSEPAALGSSMELLEIARRYLASGHYSEVVAKCRMVLEGLTQELNDVAAIKAASETPARDRTVQQRELIMRKAATDFAHLAHHPSGISLDDAFDRIAAQMMLGTTAALVSSAMYRRAAYLRSTFGSTQSAT